MPGIWDAMALIVTAVWWKMSSTKWWPFCLGLNVLSKVLLYQVNMAAVDALVPLLACPVCNHDINLALQVSGIFRINAVTNAQNDDNLF